jgi:alkylation response protein AidB-like acyl-CoA dehydrogenase
VATRVIDRAIEVYGGAGVSDDTPLAYFYAWARVLRIVDAPTPCTAARSPARNCAASARTLADWRYVCG